MPPTLPNQPERLIRDDGLRFDCRIYGYSPVQAEGRVHGLPFYFRARPEAWSFTACTNADIDPAGLTAPTDDGGFFDDGEYRGYDLTGGCGADSGAAYLSYDDAEAIIRNCVRRFIEDLAGAK